MNDAIERENELNEQRIQQIKEEVDGTSLFPK